MVSPFSAMSNSGVSSEMPFARQDEAAAGASHVLLAEQVWQTPQSEFAAQVLPTHSFVAVLHVSPAPVQSVSALHQRAGSWIFLSPAPVRGVWYFRYVKIALRSS
jgi:hypothetical protein